MQALGYNGKCEYPHHLQTVYIQQCMTSKNIIIYSLYSHTQSTGFFLYKFKKAIKIKLQIIFMVCFSNFQDVI